MLSRRHLLVAAGAPVFAARPASAAGSFAVFVAGLRAEARRSGISDATLDQAFASVRPNSKVLDLDQHQPEFTLTWAEYRASRVTEQRIAAGREAWRQNRGILNAVYGRFGVDPGVIVGIWGLESNYGGNTGGFGVVEAVATLAWDGRRARFFRPELISALRILQHGDVTAPRMTGSYAGAMGQPQFMPSAYLRYAVDFDGDGRRDIWDSTTDVLASVGNYLARSGWRAGEPWGQQVLLPPGFDTNLAGWANRRSLGEWMRAGVRRVDGSGFQRPDALGVLLVPDGDGREAFMTYANFTVLRRYNPSDYYALSVGLLGDIVVV
ncbi:MAG: lytic murein transglycosylase [Acetobacteraceae bacterium]|nr:lytic murein transglycosylase [Acetobacteraceae bacterium]